MKIYFDMPQHKLNFKYRTNFKTFLLDCERLHIPVKFSIHDRRYLGDYRAIDYNHRTIELDRFCMDNSDLINYKKSRFEWSNFGIDSIDYIEVDERITIYKKLDYKEV